jgi:hypothetical protein
VDQTYLSLPAHLRNSHRVDCYPLSRVTVRVARHLGLQMRRKSRSGPVAKQGCVGTSGRTWVFHGLESSPSLPSLPQVRQSKYLLKPPLHNPDCPKDDLVFTCERSSTAMAFEPLAARLRELGQSGYTNASRAQCSGCPRKREEKIE